MGMLTNLLGGIWGYVAAAALSAALAGYGGYRVTAWAKDETISAMKLAEQKAVTDAWQRAWSEKAARDKIVHDADVAGAAQQQKIVTVTKEIVRHVPVVITPREDRRCMLPLGFVRLLDAAGLGVAPAELPGRSAEPDSADSGIPLSQATALLAEDLGDARVLRERLKNAADAWQAQAALKPDGAQ